MISKEAEEGERPVAEPEPKKVEEPSAIVPVIVEAPLTVAEFQAQFELLSARARAAGMRPLEMMMKAYVRQGMAMLDGLLGALDDGGSVTPPSPPPKEK